MKTSFVKASASGDALAIHPDRTILVAGAVSFDQNLYPYPSAFGLARYKHDGENDYAPSNPLEAQRHPEIGFGISGAIGPNYPWDYPAYVGTSGKVITARYVTDAPTGVSTPRGFAWATALAIQSDGKIVVAGNSDLGDCCWTLARYLSK